MKKTSLLFSLLVILFSVASCGTLQSMSSGYVGCPWDRISITNENRGLGTRSWTASCGEKIYSCSANAGGQFSGTQVYCSPQSDMKQADKETKQSTGCTNDTQCKGERICEEGQCVDPKKNIDP